MPRHASQVPAAPHQALVRPPTNPRRINTCESVSKQNDFKNLWNQHLHKTGRRGGVIPKLELQSHKKGRVQRGSAKKNYARPR